MCLVSDDRKPLALCRCELPNLLQCKRKGLDGADDDLLACLQRLRKLSALTRSFRLDSCNYAGGALKVEQRILKLGVDHVAVGNDNDRGEQLLVFGVV